jgi:hypothetical protein
MVVQEYKGQMAVIKIYQRPEEAYIDAGYLGSQGVEASVNQGPA